MPNKDEELLEQRWVDVLIEWINSNASEEEFKVFIEMEKEARRLSMFR